MTLRHSQSPAYLLATLLLCVGCNRQPLARLPNPLRTGSVQSNRIVVPQRAEEERHGLPPGSLHHSASLATLTDTTVCFDLTFETVKSSTSSVDLDRKSWRLQAEPGAWTLQQPQIQPVPPRVKKAQGFVPHTQREPARQCESEGLNCRNTIVRKPGRRATDVTILSGGGRLCFAHAARISKATRRITLRYSHVGGWRSLRWDF